MSDILTMDDLVERNNLYYKKFSNVPFTGEISGIESGSFKKGNKDGEWLTYYSNGQIWTNIWSAFKGKGKYTGNDVRFPFHISYLWKDGKIIEEVQFFSTKVFDTENEAKNNQLK